MLSKYSIYIAFGLLTLMLGLAYYAMVGNSGTFDEVAHLPAGYAYVTQGDMRVNPEHPPMIKDLAGLSVAFWAKILNVKINVPTSGAGWNNPVLNERQWDFGNDFLYRSGNPAGFIFLTGRLPMLLILLLLGIYIFKWARELWGDKAGLLALFLFSFSPTFIAHGEFITTDVAAAAGVFISTYYFIRWLKSPRLKNLIVAAIVLGLAELCKFSLILLLPFFLLLTILWIIIKINDAKTEKGIINASAIPVNRLTPPPVILNQPLSWPKITIKYSIGLVIIFLISYAFVVLPVYYYHVRHYPQELQIHDMRQVLEFPVKDNWPLFNSCRNLGTLNKCPTEVAIWLAGKSTPARALGQYILGVTMTFRRASGGNTTYFLGEISAQGWHSYFPIMYLAKEPLVLHILSAMALFILIFYFYKKRPTEKIGQLPEKNLRLISRFFLWGGRNFESIAMLIFLTIYWISSISSRLNIGVRHVLPTFPLVYMLIASQLSLWLDAPKNKKTLFYLKYALIGALLAWQAVVVISAFPSFLAYYNELAGGSANGYKIAVDSNLDWGQDLARLTNWVNEQNIKQIHVDYFGGTPPASLLGEKFQPWWGDRKPSELKSEDWIAISATLLQGGRARQGAGYNKPTDYYEWLNSYSPKTVIGNSIFVYQIP